MMMKSSCSAAIGFIILFFLLNILHFSSSSPLHSSHSIKPTSPSSFSSIHVVYVLDSLSYQYFILSIASIHKYHHLLIPTIEIHTIIATSSQQEYQKISYNISQFFQCYPSLHLHSYLYLRSDHFTNLQGGHGRPHWLSTTEKLRNYIPEIIPSLTRYIYFDNDIIITKENMLYQLWDQNLHGSPLGLVGNILHSVEFDTILRVYDLNNPFIQQSFHLYPNNSHPIITKLDLQQVLPMYPNNGVMLVNATRWNELRICSLAREVEAHYHKVGLSHKLNSQVVNVLTLHRHWTFLPQKFNLRVSGSGKAEHACRIRRCSGILHFAGSYKPHIHCNVSLISPSAEYVSHIIDYLHDTCPYRQSAFPSICYNITQDVEIVCQHATSVNIQPLPPLCKIFSGLIY